MIRESNHDPTVPKPILMMAAGLCVFTIIVAGYSSHQKINLNAQRDAEIAAMINAGETKTRHVGFRDREDGSIAVVDGRTGADVTVVEPREDSFVRGVLRGFAMERQAQGVGPTPSFQLIHTSEGALILSDPSTGREVFLNAFGPDNVRAFARLMFARTGEEKQ